VAVHLGEEATTCGWRDGRATCWRGSGCREVSEGGRQERRVSVEQALEGRLPIGGDDVEESRMVGGAAVLGGDGA
jgi:hypothetical protein